MTILWMAWFRTTATYIFTCMSTFHTSQTVPTCGKSLGIASALLSCRRCPRMPEQAYVGAVPSKTNVNIQKGGGRAKENPAVAPFPLTSAWRVAIARWFTGAASPHVLVCMYRSTQLTQSRFLARDLASKLAASSDTCTAIEDIRLLQL